MHATREPSAPHIVFVDESGMACRCGFAQSCLGTLNRGAWLRG